MPFYISRQYSGGKSSQSWTLLKGYFTMRCVLLEFFTKNTDTRPVVSEKQHSGFVLNVFKHAKGKWNNRLPDRKQHGENFGFNVILFKQSLYFLQHQVTFNVIFLCLMAENPLTSSVKKKKKSTEAPFQFWLPLKSRKFDMSAFPETLFS